MWGATLRKRTSLSGGLLLVPAGGTRANGAGMSSRQHSAHAVQEGGRFERSDGSFDEDWQAEQVGAAWCAHAVSVEADPLVGVPWEAAAIGCSLSASIGCAAWGATCAACTGCQSECGSCRRIMPASACSGRTSIRHQQTK